MIYITGRCVLKEKELARFFSTYSKTDLHIAPAAADERLRPRKK
jgi:hypothetical protein